MACSSSCRTQDHASYGACMRAKNLRVTTIDATAQKKSDKNLDNYEQARRHGIQPRTTYKHDVDFAIQRSEMTGTAYKA